MRRIVVALVVCLVVGTANLSEDDDHSAKQLNNIDIFVPQSLEYTDQEPLTITDIYTEPVFVVNPSSDSHNSSFTTFYLRNGFRTVHHHHQFPELQKFFEHPGLKALIFYPHLMHNERFLGTSLGSISIQDDMKMSDLISKGNCDRKVLYVFVAPEDLFNQMSFGNTIKVGNFKVYTDVIQAHNTNFERTSVGSEFVQVERSEVGSQASVEFPITKESGTVEFAEAASTVGTVAHSHNMVHGSFQDYDDRRPEVLPSVAPLQEEKNIFDKIEDPGLKVSTSMGSNGRPEDHYYNNDYSVAQKVIVTKTQSYDPGNHLKSHSGFRLSGKVNVSIERTGTAEKLQQGGEFLASDKSEVHRRTKLDNVDSRPAFSSTLGSLIKAEAGGNKETGSGIVRTGTSNAEDVGVGIVNTGTGLVKTGAENFEIAGVGIENTGSSIVKTGADFVVNFGSSLAKTGHETVGDVAKIIETHMDKTAEEVRDDIRRNHEEGDAQSQYSDILEVSGSRKVSPRIILSGTSLSENIGPVVRPDGTLDAAVPEGSGRSVKEDGGIVDPSRSLLKGGSFARSSSDMVESHDEVHAKVASNDSCSTLSSLIKTGAGFVGNVASGIVRTVHSGADIVGKVASGAVKTGSAIVRTGTNIASNVGVGVVKTGTEIVRTGSEIVEGVGSGIVHAGSDVIEKGSELVENVGVGIVHAGTDIVRTGTGVIADVGSGIIKTGTEIVGTVSSDLVEKGNKIVGDVAKIVQSNINVTAQNVRKEFTHHHDESLLNSGISRNLETEKSLAKSFVDDDVMYNKENYSSSLDILTLKSDDRKSDSSSLIGDKLNKRSMNKHSRRDIN